LQERKLDFEIKKKGEEKFIEEGWMDNIRG
jgi:hypothetical protein